jgi:hypothetical protein
MVPPFAAMVSHVIVDMEAPDSESGDIYEQGSTISLQAAVHPGH